jgi:hypothetical protein
MRGVYCFDVRIFDVLNGNYYFTDSLNRRQS